MSNGFPVDCEVKKLKENDVNLTDIKVFKKATQKKLTSFLFSQKEHQPDEFFYKELGIAKYQELSYLVRIILILSHNQAAVERGFNHNNYVLQPNMTPNTIISKRLIKDHMLAHRLEPHTIEITKPMIKSFRAARQRYDIHLEEEKKLKEKNDAERRAQLIAAGRRT